MIKESRVYNNSDIPGIEQGYVKGEYEFFEKSKNSGSGTLKGEFTTYFYISDKGILKYDALMFVADGFCNNQFKGTWTSYSTKKSKKCNWGDFCIPDSGIFDGGVGEFSPSDKYSKFGWKSYVKMINNVVSGKKVKKDLWLLVR